jgi:hypothetical protein
MKMYSNWKLGHLTSGKNTDFKIKCLGGENSSPLCLGNWHAVKNASEELATFIFRIKELKKKI